eukprot:jgi/Mesvir1/14985/Mv14647-RA.2
MYGASAEAVQSKWGRMGQKDPLATLLAGPNEPNQRNKYEILEEIGTGSYGCALLARRKEDGELVVIKDIVVSNLSEKARREARSEVTLLEQFHHPNITQYYDCFVENGVMSIVMEFAEHGELYTKIQDAANKKQHFSEEQIMFWFVQIALALKHVHSKAVLHRDLKTQNIFCAKNDIMKLGDFGIARTLSSESDFARTTVGTPYYLSPELCEDKPYNRKSDIWSLGCVLYELTTLKHAFDGQSLPGLIMKILRGKYPPIPSHYSMQLKNLIALMLKRRPEDRPTINQVLGQPYVRQHIAAYCNHVRKHVLPPTPPGEPGTSASGWEAERRDCRDTDAVVGNHGGSSHHHHHHGHSHSHHHHHHRSKDTSTSSSGGHAGDGEDWRQEQAALLESMRHLGTDESHASRSKSASDDESSGEGSRSGDSGTGRDGDEDYGLNEHVQRPSLTHQLFNALLTEEEAASQTASPGSPGLQKPSAAAGASAAGSRTTGPGGMGSGSGKGQRGSGQRGSRAPKIGAETVPNRTKVYAHVTVDDELAAKRLAILKEKNEKREKERLRQQQLEQERLERMAEREASKAAQRAKEDAMEEEKLRHYEEQLRELAARKEQRDRMRELERQRIAAHKQGMKAVQPKLNKDDLKRQWAQRAQQEQADAAGPEGGVLWEIPGPVGERDRRRRRAEAATHAALAAPSSMSAAPRRKNSAGRGEMGRQSQPGGAGGKPPSGGSGSGGAGSDAGSNSATPPPGAMEAALAHDEEDEEEDDEEEDGGEGHEVTVDLLNMIYEMEDFLEDERDVADADAEDDAAEEQRAAEERSKTQREAVAAAAAAAAAAAGGGVSGAGGKSGEEGGKKGKTVIGRGRPGFHAAVIPPAVEEGKEEEEEDEEEKQGLGSGELGATRVSSSNEGDGLGVGGGGSSARKQVAGLPTLDLSEALLNNVEVEVAATPSGLTGSAANKIEMLRHLCEEKLGEEVFFTMYRYLRDVQDAEDEGGADEGIATQAELEKIVGVENLHYAQLVHKLIVFEDSVYGG